MENIFIKKRTSGDKGRKPSKGQRRRSIIFKQLVEEIAHRFTRGFISNSETTWSSH